MSRQVTSVCVRETIPAVGNVGFVVLACGIVAVRCVLRRRGLVA